MDQASRPSGLDFGEKVVVLLGGILASLALTAIGAVLPSIEKALAHGPTDAMLVKQLIGAVTLAMVVGAPLGGFLVDRIGMRRMLLAGSLLYAVAGTAGLYLSSLPMLLVSRLFLGLAAACMQVLALTLINTRLEGHDRARWMGLHVSIAMFSTLAIHPLSGALGTIGWRWPFAEYALGLVLFFALLASPADSRAPAAAVQAASKVQDGPGLLQWFPWHYLALALVVGSVTFLPTIYFPFQLRQQLGLTPAGIGGVLTATALVGACTAFLYGRARQHLSAHAVFAFSFAAAGIGSLVVAHAASFPVLIGGIFLYSIGGAWFVPNLMTALGAKVGTAQQSRAAGLVKAAHFLSAPLCVIVVEPYARKFGASAAMLMVSGIAFTALVATILRMVTTRAPSAMPAE